MQEASIKAILYAFLANFGIALASYTNDPRYDALGPICVGVALIVMLIFAAIRVKGLLCISRRWRENHGLGGGADTGKGLK